MTPAELLRCVVECHNCAGARPALCAEHLQLIIEAERAAGCERCTYVEPEPYPMLDPKGGNDGKDGG
jgi:hypothetical protein